VNEAATRKNTKVELSADSFTISRVKKTMKDWIRQKRRHVTTFKQYRFGSKFRLMALSMSQYLYFLTFIIVLILQFQPILVLSMFGLRLIIQLLVFNKSMKVLAEKDLFVLSPLIELILMVLYPLITLSNLLMRKNNWK